MTTASPLLLDVWSGVQARMPGVRLGGIAPGTRYQGGYHESRHTHLSGLSRTGRADYSVRLPDDLAGGPELDRYYCGLDLTGETALITRRLVAAARAGDPRVACLREILGSLDGRTTIRMTHTSPGARWVEGDPPDDSHRWHVHGSLFRRFAVDRARAGGLVDVITGVPASAPSAPPQTRPEEVWMFMIKAMDGPARYVSDGIIRRHLPSMDAVRALERAGVRSVEVKTTSELDQVAGPVAVDTAPVLDYDRLARALLRAAAEAPGS